VAWRVSEWISQVWQRKWYNSGSKWTYCWVQMSLDARWREEEIDACFVEKVHQGAENRRKQWHEELTVITMSQVWQRKWYNSGSKWTYCWVQMSLDARWREEENDACFVEKVHQGAEKGRK
jgi:hypothetical protein